jgi:hypothetical protein
MELGRHRSEVFSKRINRITLLLEVAMLSESGVRVTRTPVGCLLNVYRRKKSGLRSFVTGFPATF